MKSSKYALCTAPISGLPKTAHSQAKKAPTISLFRLEKRVLSISTRIQEAQNIQSSVSETVRRLQTGGGLEEFFALVVPAVESLKETNKRLRTQLAQEEGILDETTVRLVHALQRNDYENDGILEDELLKDVLSETQKALSVVSREHLEVEKRFPGWEKRVEKVWILQEEIGVLKTKREDVEEEALGVNTGGVGENIGTSEGAEKGTFAENHIFLENTFSCHKRARRKIPQRPPRETSTRKGALLVLQRRAPSRKPSPLSFLKNRLFLRAPVPQPRFPGMILERLQKRLEAAAYLE